MNRKLQQGFFIIILCNLDNSFANSFTTVIFFQFRRKIVWPTIQILLVLCQIYFTPAAVTDFNWMEKQLSSSGSHCWILYHWISIWSHWDLPRVVYTNLWVSLLYSFPAQHCLPFVCSLIKLTPFYLLWLLCHFLLTASSYGNRPVSLWKGQKSLIGWVY